MVGFEGAASSFVPWIDQCSTAGLKIAHPCLWSPASEITTFNAVGLHENGPIR